MEASERDLLISRIIDGRASQTDWRLLDAEAAHDPSVWRELAHAHRDHQALMAAVGRACSIADAVELPDVAHANHRFPGLLDRVRVWGGWAAAAALLIVALSRGTLGGAVPTVAPTSGNEAGMIPAGLAGPTTASDAWDRYLDLGAREGRVVGELPEKLMVETRPAADGRGYDVVFVRQILERVRVEDLYTGTTDETGSLRPVRVRIQQSSARSPM